MWRSRSRPSVVALACIEDSAVSIAAAAAVAEEVLPAIFLIKKRNLGLLVLLLVTSLRD